MANHTNRAITDVDTVRLVEVITIGVLGINDVISVFERRSLRDTRTQPHCNSTHRDSRPEGDSPTPLDHSVGANEMLAAIGDDRNDRCAGSEAQVRTHIKE